jgi:hypothetical protein
MMRGIEKLDEIVTKKEFDALQRALGGRNEEIIKLRRQISEMDRSRGVINVNMARAEDEKRRLEGERRAGEGERGKLEEERKSIEARKRIVDEEFASIRRNQAEIAMAICAPTVLSIISDINEDFKRRGGTPSAYWCRSVDAMAESEEGCVAHPDWRVRLSEEEKKKYFVRDEKGREPAEYGPELKEWIRCVRNIWAHRGSKGFADDIQLYEWVLEKWAGLVGMVVKLYGGGEKRLRMGVCLEHVGFLEEKRRELIAWYDRRKKEAKEEYERGVEAEKIKKAGKG